MQNMILVLVVFVLVLTPAVLLAQTSSAPANRPASLQRNTDQPDLVTNGSESVQVAADENDRLDDSKRASTKKSEP